MNCVFLLSTPLKIVNAIVCFIAVLVVYCWLVFFVCNKRFSYSTMSADSKSLAVF